MKEEAEESRKSLQNHEAGLTPMKREGQGRAPHSRVVCGTPSQTSGEAPGKAAKAEKQYG